MQTKEIDLIQQIRQLKDYVILDRKDYEKLVQNSKPEEFCITTINALQEQIKTLKSQLVRNVDLVDYWKSKYETCLDELKKETSKWWRF